RDLVCRSALQPTHDTPPEISRTPRRRSCCPRSHARYEGTFACGRKQRLQQKESATRIQHRLRGCQSFYVHHPPSSECFPPEHEPQSQRIESKRKATGDASMAAFVMRPWPRGG